jgi:hypothetical protein
MAGGQKHCAQQNRHVIAIAGPKFEHPSRRVKQFDSKNIARVADVSFDEVKERANLTHAILWFYAGSSKDLDGFLPHVEVFRAILD